jgi:hypothetical protein
LALITVAVAYQRIVIKRVQTASKATRENVETIAADLRKRVLDVKKRDEVLRTRDLVERGELKSFVKEANAELRCQPHRSQQHRQVLKGSQRAMKGTVSRIIAVGLKDFQNHMLQTDFKLMTSDLLFMSTSEAALGEREPKVHHSKKDAIAEASNRSGKIRSTALTRLHQPPAVHA